jgi:hypothetical protein
MNKKSVFFIYLIGFTGFLLFPDEMSQYLFLNQDKAPHIDIAFSLEEATDIDNYNSDKPLYVSDGNLRYFLSGCFYLGYVFNPSHKLTFKLPYHYLNNGHEDSYHIASLDVEYSYVINLNNLRISLAPHIKNVAYLSDDISMESNRFYDIGKNILGISFGFMDKYILSAGKYYLGWAAAAQYDISLPTDPVPWHPGVIDMYADAHFGSVFSEKMTLDISLGIGEYIALTRIDSDEKSGIYAATSLRLGAMYKIGRNAYLEAALSLFPSALLDLHPLDTIIRSRMLFGCQF